MDDINNPITLSYLERKNQIVDELRKSTLFQNIKQQLTSWEIKSDSNKYIHIYKKYALLKTSTGFYKKYFDGNLEKLISSKQLSDFFGDIVFLITVNTNYIALLSDDTGKENNKLYIFLLYNLESAIFIDENVKHYEWQDDQTIIYLKANDIDNIYRPNCVMEYDIISKKKKIIYTENNQNTWIFIGIMRDVLFLHKNNIGKSKSLHIIDKKRKTQEEVFNHNESFLSTFNGKDIFTLVKDKIYQNRQEIYLGGANSTIHSIYPTKKNIIIALKINAIDQLAIYDIGKKQIIKRILFDSPTITVRLYDNESTSLDNCIFYTYDYNQPKIFYKLSLNNFKYLPIFKEDIKNKCIFEKNIYKTEKIYFKSHDDTIVPISLFYNATKLKEKGNPIYIMGYGCYGMEILNNNIVPSRKTFLDNGIIWAFIHTRGGGEYGSKWHNDGKLLNKKNTFKDFIAGIEHLIKIKVADKEKIAITSGSAGGMLIGYTLNKCNYIKLAIMQMPYLDVLRTMLDEKQPFTPHHYKELGNPNEKKYYDYIKSYCPIENITNKKYPHILISTAVNDIRTPYWHGAKFIQKLERLKENNNTIQMLNTYMEGIGHWGIYTGEIGKDRIALEYTFLIKYLNLTKNQDG